MKARTCYKITARLTFPEGVSPGEKNSSNLQVVARNGAQQTVLRGTSLAGALRSALARLYQTDSDDSAVSQWFGSATIDDEIDASLIRVIDAPFDTPATIERRHNQIDRHRGAVVKGALYSIESLPPGTSTTVSIVLTPSERLQGQASELITDLSSLMCRGLLLGGHSNRGIGRVVVEDGIYVRQFDLDSIEGMAAWMDAEYNERKVGPELEGELIYPGKEDEDTLFSIELDLGIPRGEDLLIGDGQEVDYALQPQKVMATDGSPKWRIPGTSLRGVMRTWMTRLASREGYPTCDSYLNRKVREDLLVGADSSALNDGLGWGFVQDATEQAGYQNNPDALDDYILYLFGSFYKKSRIHISDAYIDLSEGQVQERMHIAIDGVSGGAHEGALFNNQVLTAASESFRVTITVESPYEYELKWLASTLTSLHRGILLVGSSKSSGRLEIKGLNVHSGYQHYFEQLQQEIA